MAYVIVDKKTQARLSKDGQEFSFYKTPKLMSYTDALELSESLNNVEIKPESVQHLGLAAYLSKDAAEETLKSLSKVFNSMFFELYVEKNDLNLYELNVKIDAQSPLHHKMLKMISFLLSELPYRLAHDYHTLER